MFTIVHYLSSHNPEEDFVMCTHIFCDLEVLHSTNLLVQFLVVMNQGPCLSYLILVAVVGQKF